MVDLELHAQELELPSSAVSDRYVHGRRELDVRTAPLYFVSGRKQSWRTGDGVAET